MTASVNTWVKKRVPSDAEKAASRIIDLRNRLTRSQAAVRQLRREVQILHRL